MDAAARPPAPSPLALAALERSARTLEALWGHPAFSGANPDEAIADGRTLLLLCSSNAESDPDRAEAWRSFARKALLSGADPLASVPAPAGRWSPYTAPEAVREEPQILRLLADGDKETAAFALSMADPAALPELSRNHGLLAACARSGNAAASRILLDAGADPNAPLPNGSLPLCHCATAEALQTLCAAGADLSAVCADPRAPGSTALEILLKFQCPSAREGKRVAAAALAAAQAGEASPEEKIAAAAFDALAASRWEIARQTIDKLGEKAPRFRDENGFSLLFAAARARCLPDFNRILRLGADPFETFQGGRSAFSELLFCGHQPWRGDSSRYNEAPRNRVLALELAGKRKNPLDWNRKGPDGTSIAMGIFNATLTVETEAERLVAATRFGNRLGDANAWPDELRRLPDRCIALAEEGRWSLFDGSGAPAAEILLRAVRSAGNGPAAVGEGAEGLSRWIRCARASACSPEQSTGFVKALFSDSLWPEVEYFLDPDRSRRSRWGASPFAQVPELIELLSDKTRQADLSEWTAPENFAAVHPEWAAAMEAASIAQATGPATARASAPRI